MTFAEIVDRTAKRLNLTSPEALTRISESVNDCYRRMASSVGLQTTVRQTVTQAATVSDRLLTFEDVVKLYMVFDANVTPNMQLVEISAEQMRERSLGTQPSRTYAIWQVSAQSVTIMLDAVPTSAYVYSADAEAILATMDGTSSPNFPEPFHDLLVFGGMAEELYKMEKYDKGDRYYQRYEDRLSDLRLHLATSTTRSQYQGQSEHPRWTWRW